MDSYLGQNIKMQSVIACHGKSPKYRNVEYVGFLHKAPQFWVCLDTACLGTRIVGKGCMHRPQSYEMVTPSRLNDLVCSYMEPLGL